MSLLDRQPWEEFSTWARRVQLRYGECIFFSPKYPESLAYVYQYIYWIRNAKICYDCGRRFAYEDSMAKAEYYLKWHRNNLDSWCHIPRERIKAVITLQRAWRRRRFERNCKIRFLQKKILIWLYRPDGRLMKNAEDRYYQKATTQGPQKVNSQ